MDFELREEDLRYDAAEFSRAGGEAYARCAVFRWEDFGGYLREVSATSTCTYTSF